ncbi:MAG TPA: MMPL family transporter, partial [Verrucomicrobiota bacterium]|nr:MMPL family transporter [Verrucomicrobiota bacterium]
MRVTRFLFAIGLAALAVFGLLRLHFDVEVLNLLPSELPAVQGLRIHQEHFADARELILTIQAENPDHAELAASLIAEQLRLATNLVSQVLWQPPWQEHPGLAAELIAWLWFNQPPETFSQLTNRLAPDHLENAFAAARHTLTTSLSPADIARLTYDPLGLTQLPDAVAGAAPQFGEGQEVFSSTDGTFRIVFVHAAYPLSSYVESRRWLAAVQEHVNRARALPDMPDVEIGCTGGPAFVAEISSSMQGDLTKSVGGTMIVIVLLFWWAHRRVMPLLWLLVLLAVILAGTLAIGGLLLGNINVVSIGFAAILLGLAVDYALVLYHEALDTPDAPVSTVRRTVVRSIAWSAVTTAAAFSMLNFGGLPGLAQLGSLVAIGVVLASIVMLSWYLPPLAGRLKQHSAARNKDSDHATAKRSIAPWIATATVAAVSILVLAFERPVLDHTTSSLRPRHSGAYTAMEQIQSNLVSRAEPDWLLVSGTDESRLAARLDAVKPVLARALDRNEIVGFSLPDALVPRIEHQRANQSIAAVLADRRDAIHRAATAAGFTEDATVFTRNILDAWRRAAESTPPFWPTNAVSDWILDKALVRTTNGIFALGLVTSLTNNPADPNASSWTRDLPREGVWLAGWQRIGSDLLDVVKRDLWRVVIPVFLIVFVSLWFAFRSLREVLLSFATLLFSGLALSALMAFTGWSWNLLNMLAVPLLFGVGVDYTIHMQLALRRHNGNIAAARRTTGRALFLCAGTTIAGFGSNALSNNAGLASLGLVCASGIAIAFFSAVFLLPAWWRAFASRGARAERSSSRRQTLSAPSSLYRPEFWRLGFFVVRLIPRFLCVPLARCFALAYWVLARERREVVIENLLPPCNGDRAAAVRTARSCTGNSPSRSSISGVTKRASPCSTCLAKAKAGNTSPAPAPPARAFSSSRPTLETGSSAAHGSRATASPSRSSPSPNPAKTSPNCAKPPARAGISKRSSSAAIRSPFSKSSKASNPAPPSRSSWIALPHPRPSPWNCSDAPSPRPSPLPNWRA